MVSRRYASTRSLWEQVNQAFARLGIGRGRPRRWVELMILYVSGLILLEKGQTALHMAQFLLARAHDALNRLLRTLPWSTERLNVGLIRWIQRLGEDGYLCLDDVVVEKAFAKRMAWVGWTYSPSEQRHVFGFHIVLLFWCNGVWRIPVGFRLWRPQGQGVKPYKTKLELASDLVRSILRTGLRFEYIVFDLWYNARWFTKWLDRQGIICVSTLKSNALVTYKGRTQPVGILAMGLPRRRIAGRTWAWVGTVHLVRYGNVRLAVATNGRGDLDYIVSNDLPRQGKTLIRRKRSRWDVETCIRDTKQLAGLKACQCRVPQAMERHVALVLLTFVVLQLLRLDPLETVGEVKRRLQLEVIKGGTPSPMPSIGISPRGELMAAA